MYKISDTLALVQTVDFFTPIVDDPFTFGQIAAANALSDIYAMGGAPLTAMNIAAFPVKKFPLEVLTEILRGGLDILESAGVQLLGGHTIEDNELKYGLAVTGTVHPARIVKNSGIMDGDLLILTKSLGTGIIGTAIKADMAGAREISASIKSMTSLNKRGGEIMLLHGVHACTDVSGYGLSGHLLEMVGDENIQVIIEASSLPVLPGVREYAETGLIPAGLYRNRDFAGERCRIGQSVVQYLADIFFDPQTSGGLLFSMAEGDAEKALKSLHSEGMADARIIGRVRTGNGSGINII